MKNNISFLISKLEKHAKDKPNPILYTYIKNDLEITCELTYQSLLEKVQSLGNHLKSITVPGDRVIVAHLVNDDFIVSFLACLYAGVIAVPSFPPIHYNASLRMKGVCEDCAPAYILTSTDLAPRFAKYTTPILVSDQQFPSGIWSPRYYETAFLQYTSGSTSNPKGVIITQQNLESNLIMIQENFGHSDNSIGFIWLPPFHDMGLIGGVLQPLYVGFPVYLLPPQSFLQDPLCWLKGVSQFHVTTSGGPNFAYALLTELLNQDKSITDLDLSTWEVAFNGSEPIHIETMQKFINTVEPFGFRPEALHPCYGLAEATLLVTGKPRLTKAKVSSVDIKNLDEGQPCTLIEIDQACNKNLLVSSGIIAKGIEIEIHDIETQALCPNNKIGEIWIGGPSIAKGYWQNEKTTKEQFINTNWFKSGDLGCIIDNELLVTGRVKDLIIHHGVNFYPQDIEYTATHSHPSLGSSAAFSHLENDEEKLILIIELKSKKETLNYEEVFKLILSSIAKEHEIPVHQIVIISARTLIKTTSGKIARSANKQAWLDNTLSIVTQWEHEPIHKPKKEYELDEDMPLTVWLKDYLENHIGEIPNFSNELLLAELGLDSILIFKLSGDLSRYLNKNIDPYLFWEVKTIGDLLKEIEKDDEFQFPPISKEIPPGPLPLTVVENWFWQLLKMDADNPVYTLCPALEFNDKWDESAFIKAWETLINQETSLRSYFLEENGVVSRWITDKSDWKPQIIDVHEWNSTDQQAFLVDEIKALGKIKFDFKIPSQLQVKNFLLGPNKWIMVVAISHLITDGQSLRLLMQEFAELYQSYLTGKSVVLKNELQFASYALWQNELIKNNYLSKHKEFWENELKSWTKPNLKPRSENANSCKAYDLSIKSTDLEKVKGNAKHYGISLHTYALSAWVKAILPYFPENKVTLKLISAMRNRADTFTIKGYLANGLLFTLQVPETISNEKLRELVHEKITTIIRYQDYPFELLNVEGIFSEQKTCSILFNFHNYASDKDDSAVIFRGDLVSDNTIRKDSNIFLCNVYLDNDSMLVRIKYIEECISYNEIDEIAKRFLKALE